MSVLEYDRVVAEKLRLWFPQSQNIRVLGPSQSKRLFETMADDSKDQEVELPLIALSRANDISLTLPVKNERSFRSIRLHSNEAGTRTFNAIPIDLNYSIDIIAKTEAEVLDIVRDCLFKLINNPKLYIRIPYMNENLIHKCYMRIGGTVSDTSDISEHLFPGEFYKYTIQMQMHDAHLFSITDKRNWSLVVTGLDVKTDQYIEQEDFKDLEEDD